MAKMIRLDPAPKESLPCGGFELIATEAGRYAVGSRATVQLWNGTVQDTAQLALAYQRSWDDFVARVTGLTGMTHVDVVKAILTLARAVEGALR